VCMILLIMLRPLPHISFLVHQSSCLSALYRVLNYLIMNRRYMRRTLTPLTSEHVFETLLENTYIFEQCATVAMTTELLLECKIKHDRRAEVCI
jgi:hypothetical protein